MATHDNRTVVGVFDDRATAEAAMDELRHAGCAAENIGFVSRGESGTANETPTAREENQAENAAVTGAVAGGALGAVAGAAAVALIPGIGPVLAGGLLLGAFGGAAAGAAVGTFLGPFVSMGLSEEEARTYEQEFNMGRTVVTVRAGDRFEQAADLLRRYGAIRVNAPPAGKPTIEQLPEPTGP